MSQNKENTESNILSIPVVRDAPAQTARASRRQFKRQLEATGSQLTRLQITVRNLMEIVTRLGIEIEMSRQQVLTTLLNSSEKETSE
jgi:hypothetical protein